MVLQSTASELSVPGAAAAVYSEGQVEVATHGVTSVTNPLPVDQHTLFQIGSVTKTLTTTALMVLEEGGRVGLDDRVVDHIPRFSLQDVQVAREVTILDLLTHQGGWDGDIFADTGDGDDALEKMVQVLRDTPQLFPLRRHFSYNNSGFYIAGRIVEVLTGMRYEGALRELVLAPLGLTESAFPFRDLIWRRFALGHVTKEDVPVVLRRQTLARNANAVGGLFMSVRDLIAYACFQLGEMEPGTDGRVLSGVTRRKMQMPVRRADPSISDSVGLSWFIRETGGRTIVWHGGGTTGQKATLQMVPDARFVVCCLTNSDRGGDLHRAVVNWALEAHLGIADAEPRQIEPARETLGRLAGRYERINLRLLVMEDGGGLRVRLQRVGTDDQLSAPEDAQLRLVSNDSFVIVAGSHQGERGRFLLGPQGLPEYMSLGGRLARRVSAA